MTSPTELDRIALRVPEHVLHQKINDQSALLHLETEIYFGLDDVGTQMWEAIHASENMAGAFALLADKYDVAPEVLKADLIELADQLERHDLLVVTR